MDARFFIAWVVVFVLWMLGGFLVHGAWLSGEYAKLVNLSLLTAAPTYLIYYAVQPMPRGLVARQIIGDSIVLLVLGVVVAWLHRDAGRSA